MKNSVIIFVVVGVIAVLGIGAYTLSQNSTEKDSMMKKDPSTSSEQDAAMEKDDTMMQKSDNRYVEYTKAALDGAANNRRVLFFYASWCPTCRPTDSDLRANLSKIPSDVTVIRVNYNDPETDQEEKDLASQYGVTYQHTFVQIDEQGKEVTKWNGGRTDELLAKLK